MSCGRPLLGACPQTPRGSAYHRLHLMVIMLLIARNRRLCNAKGWGCWMFKNGIPFFQSNIQKLNITIEDALFRYGADDSKAVAHLLAVYNQVNEHYSSAIDWYSRNAASSRRFSRFIRFIGLACIFFAAAWPALQGVGFSRFISFLIEQILGFNNAENYINQFGYLAAAIGLSAIVFDRYGGASASWIRYMQAVALLQAHSACFQVQWSNLLTEGANLDALRNHLHSMTHTLVKTIDDETQEWAYLYRDSLNRMATHLDHFGEVGRQDNKSSPAPDVSPTPNTTPQ